MHPLTSSVTSGRLRPCFLICKMRIITLVLPTSAWLLWILTTTVTEYFQEMKHYLNPKYQKGLPIPWRACIANMEALGQWDVTNGEVLEACSLLLSSVPKCWLNPLATYKGLKDHPEPKQVAWAPTQLPSCLSSSDLFLLEAGFLFLSGKTCLQKLAHEESKEEHFFQVALEFHQVILLTWIKIGCDSSCVLGGFHSPCIFPGDHILCD